MKLPDGVSSLVYRDDDGREIVRKLQPEWIPVSERLPEDRQQVLVDYCDSWGLKIIEFRKTKNWSFKAWMPLPEPYREDGGMND